MHLRYVVPMIVIGGISAAIIYLAYRADRWADAWFDGDAEPARALADELVEYEARDDLATTSAGSDQFAGEWLLVTHQMIALGLAQLCSDHPELRAQYAPVATRAARKTWLPRMRAFGTQRWHGEDVLTSLDGPHGHAYFGYAALAVGLARQVDPNFPAELAHQHDALIEAFVRRLSASETGLIETYPGEAYPTDVAAVVAAIAVHARVSHLDRSAVLQHWADNVRRVQIDPHSGLFIQRLDATTGEPRDVPRGSGTGLGAYFAGFADRSVAQLLAAGLFKHEAQWCGFGAIREYAAGFSGSGDVDSGPVILGVSVAATGFALAPARTQRKREVFTRIYRTTHLFGMPIFWRGRLRYLTGGSLGNALLFALLTSRISR